MDQAITDTFDIEERDDDYYQMMDYRREAEEAERDEAEEISSKEKMEEFLSEKITNGEDIGSAEDRAPYRHILLEEARQKLEKNKNTDYDLLFQAFSKLSEQFEKNVGADNLLDVFNRISYQVSYINEYGDRFLSSSFFSGISKGGREKRSLVREICGYVKKDLAEFTEKSAYAAMVPNYGSVDDLIKFKTDNIKDEPVEVDDGLSDNGRELLSSEMRLTKKSSADGIEYQILNEYMDKVDNELNTLVNKDNYAISIKNLKSEYYQLVTYGEEYLHTHSGKRWTSVGKKRVELVKEMLLMCAKEMTIIDAVGLSLGSTQKPVSWKELINKNGNVLAANPMLKENVADTLNLLGQYLGNDLNIMSAEQFQALIHMTEGEIPESIKEVIFLLEVYHKNENISRDDYNKSRLMSRNSVEILKSRCKGLKKQYKRNAQLSSALGTLEIQLDRRFTQFSTIDKSAPEKIPENYHDRSSLTQSVRTGEHYEEELGDAFSEYTYLTNDEYEGMADANKYNFGEYRNKLYGTDESGNISSEGSDYGYIQTSNSSRVNQYIRNGRKNEEEKWSQKADQTIENLDAASKINAFPKKTRVIRFLGISYLEALFGAKDFNCVTKDVVDNINKSAGKIITDKGFMCVGYKGDFTFSGSPVMLTLLCDEGKSCFATKNKQEGELILGQNTSYMILGANVRKGNAKQIRISEDFSDFDQKDGDTLAYYEGLEIVAKVL